MIMSLLLCVLLGPPAVDASPQRVVSQTVGTDELLLALADARQIASLSDLSRNAEFSLSAGEAKAYPRLRSSDAESVMRFHPDLVLAASYSGEATLALLRRAGVKLVVIDRFESLEDVYANIRAVGAALGHAERAEALVRDTKRRVAELARSPDVEPYGTAPIAFDLFQEGLLLRYRHSPRVIRCLQPPTRARIIRPVPSFGTNRRLDDGQSMSALPGHLRHQPVPLLPRRHRPQCRDTGPCFRSWYARARAGRLVQMSAVKGRPEMAKRRDWPAGF